MPGRIPIWDYPIHYPWVYCLRPVGLYFAHHPLAAVTELGAGATFLGVVAGALLAFIYGRKGSVSVSGVAYYTPYGLVVAARPCVRAVGVFRVKFRRKVGATVRLQEVYLIGGALKSGRWWDELEVFKQQFVDAGEDLNTTVVFAPEPAPPTMIGWNIFLNIAAPRPLWGLRTLSRLFRPRASWWADQAFVCRPQEPPPPPIMDREREETNDRSGGATESGSRRRPALWQSPQGWFRSRYPARRPPSLG